MKTTNAKENAMNNSDTNLLERDFLRGSLAGFIVVIGLTLALFIQQYLFIETYNNVTKIIVNLIVPFTTIYLFSRFVTSILRRYGFDGFHKGEKLTFLKMLGVLFGALVTGFLLFNGMLLFDSLVG